MARSAFLRLNGTRSAKALHKAMLNFKPKFLKSLPTYFEEWLRDNRPRRREVLLRIQQEKQELVVQQGRRHPRALQLQ